MSEHDREDIEKVRQEIMRFRELLNIMRENLQDSERVYTELFSKCTPDEKSTLKEKDLQWVVAEQIMDDLSPLRRAVMRARFDTMTLEHSFEELYNIIVSVPEP